MPYAPNVNPNLGAIMMAQGIKEAGEALGGAAGGLASAGMGGSASAGFAQGLGLGGNLGSGAIGGDFLSQLKSFGLSDEQIAQYRQYLANPQAFQNYTGPRDFGVE